LLLYGRLPEDQVVNAALWASFFGLSFFGIVFSDKWIIKVLPGKNFPHLLVASTV
jgi:hypothetical protein